MVSGSGAMSDEQKNVTINAEPIGDGHQKWTLDGPAGTLKALDTPLAKEYAENLLLQSDMRDSLAAMECWERRFASSTDPEDKLIGASLFRDAIIQFVGCFDKTAQFPLSAQDIYGHDPDGLSSFQWFKNTRGIGHLFAKYRGQNKADGAVLRGFMQTAANFLDARVQSLRKT
jgi:hypothetical protein